MKLRYVISIILILASAIGTWLALRWANSPVKQRISSTDSAVVAPEARASSVEVKTDYYVTKLPSGYQVEITKNPKNPKMVTMSAFTKEGNQAQVGITTALLPSDGLRGVADYQYRAKETSLYTPVKSALFSSDSSDFEKVGGGEFTTFITQNDRYASISVSGQGVSTDDLQALRQFIASHWFWT